MTHDRKAARRVGGGRRTLGRVASAGVAAAVAGLGIAALPATDASAAGSINICMVQATTGVFSVLGLGNIQGIKAWAKSVNSSGGLLGKKVDLTEENDNSDPATAAGLIRKCVTQDSANFILGPENTDETTAAVPVANQLKTVEIDDTSNWQGTGISDTNLVGYAFPGIWNPYDDDDLVMVQDIIAPRHYKRVAVIQDNGPGADTNGTYTASLGKKYGFKVVATQTVQSGSTDDTPEALNLMKKKPQAIVLGVSPGPDSLSALKAIRALSPTIPIGLGAGTTSPSFVKSAGGYAGLKDVYMVGTPEQTYQSLKKLPASTKVGATTAGVALKADEAYLNGLKAAGTDSSSDISTDGAGWDTGTELAQAIDKAHSTSEDAVKNALAHQNITLGAGAVVVFHRTPKNYYNIASTNVPVAIVLPNNSLGIYRAP